MVEDVKWTCHWKHWAMGQLLHRKLYHRLQRLCMASKVFISTTVVAMPCRKEVHNKTKQHSQPYGVVVVWLASSTRY